MFISLLLLIAESELGNENFNRELPICQHSQWTYDGKFILVLPDLHGVDSMIIFHRSF